MRPRFAAVIFDLDGTLVDTEALHQRSWEIVLERLGLPFQPKDYVQFFSGRPGRLICQDRFGMSAEEALRTSDLVTEVYWELAAGRLAPLPGLTAFLDRLDGLGTAVATSARRRSALRMLRELALLDRFAAIITADDVVHGKPHPEPFLTAANRLGAPPGRCLAIEDSPAGLRAARAAGMTCVGLTTTHTDLPDAHVVIDSYEDPRLLALLAGEDGFIREGAP